MAGTLLKKHGFGQTEEKKEAIKRSLGRAGRGGKRGRGGQKRREKRRESKVNGDLQ